jgi:hypothetical protein
MKGMEREELNAVTAAILADAAFDSLGDAIKLSTRLYRETFDNIRRSGELPPAWRTTTIASEQSLIPGSLTRYRTRDVVVLSCATPRRDW